mmetsp:Transcript_109558/g.353581  ORF Transcript_109558/g.353581 Transcript_109558/m.353581 type:complete len:424 (-) Transcript_109558:266-1537(-)
MAVRICVSSSSRWLHASSWSFAQSSASPWYSTSKRCTPAASSACRAASTRWKSSNRFTASCWCSSWRFRTSVIRCTRLRASSRQASRPGRTSACTSSCAEACSPHSRRASWASKSWPSCVSSSSAVARRLSKQLRSSTTRWSNASCARSCSAEARSSKPSTLAAERPSGTAANSSATSPARASVASSCCSRARSRISRIASGRRNSSPRMRSCICSNVWRCRWHFHRRKPWCHRVLYAFACSRAWTVSFAQSALAARWFSRSALLSCTVRCSVRRSTSPGTRCAAVHRPSAKPRNSSSPRARRRPSDASSWAPSSPIRARRASVTASSAAKTPRTSDSSRLPKPRLAAPTVPASSPDCAATSASSKGRRSSSASGSEASRSRRAAAAASCASVAQASAKLSISRSKASRAASCRTLREARKAS